MKWFFSGHVFFWGTSGHERREAGGGNEGGHAGRHAGWLVYLSMALFFFLRRYST